ncbi:hypothetical protein [Archangium lipolyticum]|uniref:hypothetical protein n=1 Tax=Archangium lipolyticum TaxID=2970465 RepID=UPI002149E244|nr:hypothetical protein [Archangium lipolyticum]
MAPAPPRLTFFCELEPEPLVALFAGPAVVEHLLALRASVSLGVLDLGPERAAVVRRLNEAGVPVIAWQLLPKAEGYWFHLGNAPQAEARYEAFRAWTAGHCLRWDGVGLDIEPDIHDMRRLLASRWRLLPALLPRLGRGGQLREARARYGALMARIRADGYRVDSYQLPLIVDERRAGSTLLQRLGGVLDLEADREVLMLYSSFVRPHGPALAWSYGPDARSIGVGVTGGGVDVPGLIEVPPLDWEEFTRDLRLARRWTEDLHVFSLEGCVRQGFLARLRDFDWTVPAEAPPASARRLDGLRRAASLVLRIGF